MATQIFVNLAVRDLKKSKFFFEKLGFLFHPQFTNADGACMLINRGSFVMLLTESFFKTFTKKKIVNATKSTEVLIALSRESRKEVDELMTKALTLGAIECNEAHQDHGFMYGRSFCDPDGHIWEVIWMAPAAGPK